MFKVMIVDDEPAIREGLKTIIDWDQIGFEVVDAAANGREALQKFERIQPDLMIMDIRMPGMSGLEVIEQLRRDHNQAHVLILSGYADFEYARRALGYGVDGYLLKPVDEEEMEQELRRVYQSLAQERKKSRISLQSAPLHELIEQMLMSSSGKEQERAQHSLTLNWNSYQIILLEVRAGDGDHADRIANRFRRFQKLWAVEDQHIIFHAGAYLGILSGRPYGESELIELRTRLMDETDSNEQWYAAASEIMTELDEIHDAYAQVLDVLDERFWFDESGIQLYTAAAEEVSAAENDSAVDAPQPGEWADRLYYAVDIRSQAAAERVLQDLLHACQHTHVSERDTKSLCSHVMSMALSRLPGSVAGSGPAVQRCLALIPELYATATAGDLIRLMTDGLEQLLNALDGNSHESVMKQMTDFIQRNYSDNLKLELLAEVFNYNSAYLGKMFKTYTGESFNHFLDQVRLEKAKELLAAGTKVHKVASQVGYANVDYFHSKFKKYTGVSPSAYREQLTNQEQTDCPDF